VASPTLRPLYPQERHSVPIVQEVGWAPGPSWTAAENLAPPGFDPRTVQPVASHYTDYDIPAHWMFWRTEEAYCTSQESNHKPTLCSR
jgi:hypothetical protein